MLSVNRTCLLHEDFKKFQFFHLDQWSSELWGTICMLGVCVCVSRVGVFFVFVLGDEPIREVYHQNKIK